MVRGRPEFRKFRCEIWVARAAREISRDLGARRQFRERFASSPRRNRGILREGSLMDQSSRNGSYRLLSNKAALPLEKHTMLARLARAGSALLARATIALYRKQASIAVK